MAHKNYGGVEHGNTGYANHTNNNSSEGYAQQHSQYHQAGDHNNYGYARGYVNGYNQDVYDYHQSGDHVNTGYSRGYNNGYNQDHGQYYNYYDYYEGCSGCCRDRKTRKDFLDENFNDGNSTRNGILRGYGQYSQSGNHTNYGYSRGYVNGYNQDYTDYHQSGDHTNTGYLRGYSNGYSQDYGQYNQSVGYNNHGNGGYTNHVNTTTNNPPSVNGTPDRGPAAYYKSSISLTWGAATDTPAYPISEWYPSWHSGFGDWGAPWAPVKVWRTREGTVYIRGLVSVSTTGIMFYLPEGWRPTGGALIYCQSHQGYAARVNIHPSGAVELWHTPLTPAGTWLTLNICFSSDPNGWIPVPLLNRCTNYDSNNGWQMARYKTIENGITFVEGLVTASGNGVVLGTIGVGAAPRGRIITLSCGNDKAMRLDFLEDGQIYIDVLGYSVGWVSINGAFMSKSRAGEAVAIGLSNGWGNYANGYTGASYIKLESREVFIEGLISGGAENDGIILDVPDINPTNTYIMSQNVMAGTTYDAGIASLQHWNNGQGNLWNCSTSWTSMCYGYIMDTGTITQQVSYYVDYRFKPLGGSYGDWVRYTNGHTSTSLEFPLANFGNGHIQFRVLSFDGVENSGVWVDSSEVRVLKYNAPSDWPTDNYVLSVDFTSVKNEITTLANSILSTAPTADVAAGSIVTGTAMTNLRDTTKEAASILGLTPIADTNLGFVTKADLDNIKAWLKGV